jgi:hypothetical protein
MSGFFTENASETRPTVRRRIRELFDLSFVDPAFLPAGPFLAYGHNGKPVGTIYMRLKTCSGHHRLLTTH